MRTGNTEYRYCKINRINKYLELVKRRPEYRLSKLMYRCVTKTSQNGGKKRSARTESVTLIFMAARSSCMLIYEHLQRSVAYLDKNSDSVGVMPLAGKSS
jgi:hypothetical protein